MGYQIKSRLMVLLLVMGLCYLAEQGGSAAPALPPKCDTTCRNWEGPFVSSGGKCYDYSANACRMCSGSSYYCQEIRSAGDGNQCVGIWVPGYWSGGTWYPGYWSQIQQLRLVRIVNDSEECPCVKTCASANPGSEATPDGGGFDEVGAVMVKRRVCSTPGEPPDEIEPW
jgi:hypothetical protein